MSDKSKRTFNRWTSSEEDHLKIIRKNITLNDIADFFPREQINKYVQSMTTCLKQKETR